MEAAIDLTHRIKRDFAYDPDATDISTPLLQVLKLRRGVCQDFAHVQIGCLRSLGLAGRYASGYIRTRPRAGQEALRGADASHAWVSVRCGEAAGWIDVDPTNDLVVTDQHVLLAWGRDFSDVSPVRGVILGGGHHTFGVAVDLRPVETGTYLLGKKIVEEGLSKRVFKKKDDGSVWIDLTADGLDEKLSLRSDGTSVYITQDLGTIIQRANEFHFDKHIYVVGNEQDYHFKVLFLILEKLGYDWADKLYHLSYGMVDLPSGKMKSREGTVVDADELMEEMVSTARETTKALGKTEGMSEAEADQLYHNIGLGALKYFILKVDPKKRMLLERYADLSCRHDAPQGNDPSRDRGGAAGGKRRPMPPAPADAHRKYAPRARVNRPRIRR